MDNHARHVTRLSPQQMPSVRLRAAAAADRRVSRPDRRAARRPGPARAPATRGPCTASRCRRSGPGDHERVRPSPRGQQAGGGRDASPASSAWSRRPRARRPRARAQRASGRRAARALALSAETARAGTRRRSRAASGRLEEAARWPVRARSSATCRAGCASRRRRRDAPPQRGRGRARSPRAPGRCAAPGASPTRRSP